MGHLLLKSPFAVALFKGEDMVVDLANNAIKEMWGKGKNVEGKSLFEILPELNNQEIKKLLLDVFITGQPYIGIEKMVVIKRQ